MSVRNESPHRRRRWRLPLIASAALMAAGALVLPGSGASAQPTRYEAESEAATCSGTIDSNHFGYSGSGFCNGANEVGAALQVTVTAGSAGTAMVGIRFANGTSTARPADLIVNGSTVGSVSFEPTGAWSTWATKTVTVTLGAGSNTIRLNPTSSAGLPNVDYLDVETSAAPSRHEAESSSATCDGTIDSNHSGYSGSGFCNTSNAVGAAVQFTVEAPESGTATLQVRFANGTSAARPADLMVNGSTVTSTSFEGTGAWSTWATKTVTATVNSGSNTIRLSATGSAGLPNVDYLDFTMGGDTPPPPPPPADGPVGWASVEGGTTGGDGGETVTVTDGSTLARLLEEDRPLVIRVQGMLSMPDGMNDVHSDKTIIGVGANSGLDSGLNISSGYHNIIIRNLNFRGWPDDAVNVQNSAHHIWVDHNSFSNGGDGAVDVKRGSDFVTVSWNRFFNHQKLMLLGHDDNNGGQDIGHLRVTYHHNWFDGTAERHPRVRFGNPVHVFNNYYDAVSVYGVASTTTEAGVLVENNYFENTGTPCVRGYGDSPDPGGLAQRGNHFVSSGTCESGGSVRSIPYSYRLDSASDVKSIVMAGAGPQ